MAASDRRQTSDPRPYIYAALDAVFAAVYVALVTGPLYTRHLGGRILLWAIVVGAVAAGAAMMARGRWGWRVAVAVCGFQLAVAIVVLGLVVAAAAFMAGVYGAFGEAASMGALLVGALVVELVALLPAFQLKYLMTRAGRRAFGLEPLWTNTRTEA